jgi:hypothetical protein
VGSNPTPSASYRLIHERVQKGSLFTLAIRVFIRRAHARGGPTRRHAVRVERALTPHDCGTDQCGRHPLDAPRPPRGLVRVRGRLRCIGGAPAASAAPSTPAVSPWREWMGARIVGFSSRAVFRDQHSERAWQKLLVTFSVLCSCSTSRSTFPLKPDIRLRHKDHPWGLRRSRKPLSPSDPR